VVVKRKEEKEEQKKTCFFSREKKTKIKIFIFFSPGAQKKRRESPGELTVGGLRCIFCRQAIFCCLFLLREKSYASVKNVLLFAENTITLMVSFAMVCCQIANHVFAENRGEGYIL